MNRSRSPSPSILLYPVPRNSRPRPEPRSRSRWYVACLTGANDSPRAGAVAYTHGAGFAGGRWLPRPPCGPPSRRQPRAAPGAPSVRSARPAALSLSHAHPSRPRPCDPLATKLCLPKCSIAVNEIAPRGILSGESGECGDHDARLPIRSGTRPEGDRRDGASWRAIYDATFDRLSPSSITKSQPDEVMDLLQRPICSLPEPRPVRGEAPLETWLRAIALRKAKAGRDARALLPAHVRLDGDPPTRRSLSSRTCTLRAKRARCDGRCASCPPASVARSCCGRWRDELPGGRGCARMRRGHGPRAPCAGAAAHASDPRLVADPDQMAGTRETRS